MAPRHLHGGAAFNVLGHPPRSPFLDFTDTNPQKWKDAAEGETPPGAARHLVRCTVRGGGQWIPPGCAGEHRCRAHEVGGRRVEEEHVAATLLLLRIVPGLGDEHR